MKKYFWYWIAFVLALLAAVGWWFMQNKTDAVSYKTAKIERGHLQATVSASGAVNPVTQVSVGTQISGQIKDLYVDFNSEVKAGQLIAQIDPETYEYRVRQAQADVEAAQAVAMTQQAVLSKSRVDADDAAKLAERKKLLVEKQFIAASDADTAVATARSLAESVKVAEAQLRSAQASVAQRQALLAQSKIDLAHTKIISPVSGMVIKRAIEKGQTVAASLQSPELFVIAQNLRDMQVEASIDESDVGRIKSGQRATFTVDAFAGQTFEGTVNQVRKAAQSVANVVTYVAIVGFSNNDGRLLPGMTANVRVVTDSREAILKIPNAALRVKIAGVEPAMSNAPSPQATASMASTRADVPPLSSALKPPAGGVAPAITGQGPLVDVRNRLVAELQMPQAQADKLDAIYAANRPKFGALRDLPEAERGKARERISADIRVQIDSILMPEQKPRYAQLVAEAASRQGANSRGRIYLQGADGKPTAYNVRLGVTDGTSTELIVSPNSSNADKLSEGAMVIIGIASGAAGGTAKAPTGPRLPF